MTIYIDENKNIYLRKGDTGQILIKGVPIGYNVYLSIYNPDTNKIIKETQPVDAISGRAIIEFSNVFSDSLKVGEWLYGVKICSGSGISSTEDTLLPRMYIQDGQLIQEQAPSFVVFDKYVEGN